MACRNLSSLGCWRTSMQFAADNHKVQISIRLPLQALEDMEFIDRLMAHLPDKVRENGFLIAVDCVDLVNELVLVRRIASQLAARNIGISIDGIDAQGATLAGRRELPVVEMKVDRKYIRGCAPTTGSSRPTARRSWRPRAIPVQNPSPWVWRRSRTFSSFAISGSTCCRATCSPSPWRCANSSGQCSPAVTRRLRSADAFEI